MQLPENIKSWLNGRGITDEVIEVAGLSWKNDSIVIPVFDINGNFLFNKYRKNPFDKSNKPKYTYDKGGQATLYNLQNLNKQSHVIICEGELDVLLLMSKGFSAITSTGGAGTFKDEWGAMLTQSNQSVYICLDNDEAGIRGTYNIQVKIKRAQIIWLPRDLGEHADVTDYFKRYNKIDFEQLMLNALPYYIPEPADLAFNNKKSLKDKIKNDSIEANNWLGQRRLLLANKMSVRHIDVLLDIIVKNIEEDKKKLKTMGRPKSKETGDRILRAKQIPIDTIIKFNSSRMAPCIWHNEKDASMHYYPKQNQVKCFGCDKMGDPIDVIQEMKGLSFNEALKYLLHD